MLQKLLMGRFKRRARPYQDMDDFVCMVASRLSSLRKQGLWPRRVHPLKRIPDDTLICSITTEQSHPVQVHRVCGKYFLLCENFEAPATYVEVRSPFDIIRLVYERSGVDLRDYVIESNHKSVLSK